MAGSRLLKVIHVVGYLTTLLVLVEAAGVGYLYWTLWRRSEPARVRNRESTRTHERALGPAETIVTKAYEPVRPRSGKDGDAIGFVFMPSFFRWYAASLSLAGDAQVAQGEIIYVQYDNRDGQLTFSPAQTFTVPRTAYVVAARQIDQLTDGWPGSGHDGCYDGLGVAFERVKAGHVSSGVGNSGCDKHYMAVEQVMNPLFVRYVPKPAKGAPPLTNKGPAAPGSGPANLAISGPPRGA